MDIDMAASLRTRCGRCRSAQCACRVRAPGLVLWELFAMRLLDLMELAAKHNRTPERDGDRELLHRPRMLLTNCKATAKARNHHHAKDNDEAKEYSLLLARRVVKAW